MKNIRLTGPPRSGTTLMLELMVTCFAIDLYRKNEKNIFAFPPDTKPDTTVCTKNPDQWSTIPELFKCAPKLSVVFMVRDPRNVVVSINQLRPDIYWANLRQWLESWNSIKSCVVHPHLVLVRYEILVRAPDKTQRKITSRMPFLKPKLPFSNFHIHSTPST